MPKRNITFSSDGGNLTNTSFNAANEGKYTLTAKSDNENYELEIYVSDNLLNLRVDDVEKYVGGSENLTVKLTDSNQIPISNATVKIKINGKEYERITNDMGIATMTINLSPGDYNVTTNYDFYTTNSKVTVKSTINSSDIVKIYKNATQYYATFRDTEGNYLTNGTSVTFNINGVFYTRNIASKGTARLNINLSPGEYILTAINPINNESASNIIKVLAPIVNNTDLIKYYKNASQYEFTVLDSTGNVVGEGVNVTFNINGMKYTRKTNENGVAKLNINLDPGDYIITTEYGEFMISNNIKVLSILNTSDFTKVYGTLDQFKAQLFDSVGNPYANVNITFNINGVVYERLTDNNGIASLNINLMPGEYIITSSYNGYSVGNTVKVEGI